MLNINLHYIVRKLIREKWTSLIIVGGLAIGIAVCLLLTLYVNDELSYDKHFKDYDRIYRITTVVITGDELQHLAVSPKILGYILKEEYPEINEATYIFDSPFKYNIKYEDKLFIQEGIRIVSPEIFNVFSYPFLAGNPDEALNNPGSIVLIESLALKIFGNVQLAMGQNLILDDEIFTVTGILKNLPKNSDLQFTALLPNPYTGDEEFLDMEGYTFIKSINADEDQLNQILQNVIAEKYQPLLYEQMPGVELQYKLQPISEIHFSEKLLADTPKGNKNNLYIFSLIALFVLIIACVNHVNLSMALYSKKAFTMGVQKISGAKKGQLIRGNIIEACLITGVSLILGIYLLILLIPVMNLLTSKNIEPFDLFKPGIIFIMFSIYLMINFLTGYLPSLVFNKKTTVQLINQSGLAFKKNYRMPLVTLQFIISIVMLSGFFVFYKQLHYMKNMDLGYNVKNLVALEVAAYDTLNFRKARILVRELKQQPEIYGVSMGEGGSYFGANHRGLKSIFADEINGNYKQFVIHYIDVDEHFINLTGIKLLAGINFGENGSEEIFSDRIIVNEAYSKAMELGDDPIGKTSPGGGNVIGLVQDFHFMPLQNKIEPVCFRFRNKHPEHIYVKIDSASIHLVKNLWEKYMEGSPFIARSVVDNYFQGYKNEEADLKVINFFTLLSILTTCIGLLGLIRFISESKTKEIGIRKVNGAKIWQVMLMLNMDFVKWVAIAFVIATPIAYFAMDKWLQNFAYRTPLSWWVFALAGLLALAIALITVSWQSWLAARRNPVEALRYE